MFHVRERILSDDTKAEGLPSMPLSKNELGCELALIYF